MCSGRDPVWGFSCALARLSLFRRTRSWVCEVCVVGRDVELGDEMVQSDSHFKARVTQQLYLEDAGEVKLKLAVLQRVCPAYRRALFSQLCSADEVEAHLFIGDDVPNSKVKSTTDFGTIALTRLPTIFMKAGARTLTWHVGLISQLRRFSPDVILCEGESHFLGYIQAIIYRMLFNRRAALIHWCFVALPGENTDGKRWSKIIKSFFRRRFDGFVVYSSFSKQSLIRLGVEAERIFVATNVCDTDLFVEQANRLEHTRAQARQQLRLPESFTVLYAGTMDENKRPGVMLDLACSSESNGISFVLIGVGPLLGSLRRRVDDESLSNVFLPGRVSSEMAMYLRAADVLLIPGRGGIVISEAMAFGLPVIVHEADGTEVDLVQDGCTGIRVGTGTVDNFLSAVRMLIANPGLRAEMATNCRDSVLCTFNTRNMVERIMSAAAFVCSHRASKISPGSSDSKRAA
jgi:glycosyltransferase involved in cell wall biosynthesis